MTTQQELTMYIITSQSIKYRNSRNPQEGISMEITLKRRVANELLITYLPSVLLILITYATTFFRPLYFKAVITGNMTTLLTLTTIFVAVMQKLPSTSYVKFVDIWLIFGQLIPFIEVCLRTAMEYFRDGVVIGQGIASHNGQPIRVGPINQLELGTLSNGEVNVS